MGDDCVQVKFECKEVDPPAKTAELYTFSLNSGTITDSEKKVQLRLIESRPWAFQRASNQGLPLPLTSQKLAQIPKFNVLRINVHNKTLKVCYTVSLSKNFQRQSCSAINYLSNSINILAGNDPIPVKFRLKAPTPNSNTPKFHVCKALCSQG